MVFLKCPAGLVSCMKGALQGLEMGKTVKIRGIWGRCGYIFLLTFELTKLIGGISLALCQQHLKYYFWYHFIILIREISVISGSRDSL